MAAKGQVIFSSWSALSPPNLKRAERPRRVGAKRLPLASTEHHGRLILGGVDKGQRKSDRRIMAV